MKTIVHLSDLHFGRIDDVVSADLKAAIERTAPDLVVVSGDLTQRAKVREFSEARRFLQSLPAPKVVVPGNHDVPLYDVFRRFFRPLSRYKRLVTGNLAPFYSDTEIAVAGINTARSLTFKNGRINERQLEEITSKFAGLSPEITRIVVVHHPFGHSATRDERDVVGRAALAFETFFKSRIDFILAGHLHSARVSSSSERYEIAGYSALLIQAGTATSTRRRGESNSFNIIRIERPHMEVHCMSWKEGKGFVRSSKEGFVYGSKGWVKAASSDADSLEKGHSDK